MAGMGANASISSVRETIHSLESARSEGKTGMEAGSKIFNTKDAIYKKGSK